MAAGQQIEITNRLEWGVILAGGFAAVAISIVLSQFGLAIGLSADAPLRAENLASWQVIATGIWLLWIQLIASLIGGYIAGRMRTPSQVISHEVEVQDGIHGAIVWALGTVSVFIFAAIAAAYATHIAMITGTYQSPDTMTDAERNTAILFAFGAVTSSIVSLVVAWWAATQGGEHRDNKVDLSELLSFKRRK